MKLRLKRLSAATRGIYNTKAGPNTLPERFRLLHPEAAYAFVALEQDTGGLVYSDILRSADESLEALRTKAGVQPPGFSGHNFGFSVDIAVDATLKLRGWTYAQLLERAAQFDWFCHRRDGAVGAGQSESWHFNYLPDRELLALAARNWAAPLEALIIARYGNDFLLDARAVQAALAKLRLYTGDVDGLTGPLTMQGLGAFRRAWLLDKAPADRIYRTLAFVAADREVID